MARPKSDDPKRAVTLRLPASVVAGFEAMGDGWRGRMEALIVGGGRGVAVAEIDRPTPVARSRQVATAAKAVPAATFGYVRPKPGALLKKR